MIETRLMSVRWTARVAVASLLGMGTAAVAEESAQVAKGRAHYAQTCALCHGEDGKRGAAFQTPIWGSGAMIGPKFGNVRGLIDYMQLMPFDDPTRLDDTQKLAVVAYMLVKHGSIKASDTIDPAKAAATPIR